MLNALRRLFGPPEPRDLIEPGRRLVAATIRSYARIVGPSRFTIVATAQRDDPQILRFFAAFDAADFEALRAFSRLALTGDGFIVYAIEETDATRDARLILVDDPNDLFLSTQFFKERAIDAAAKARLDALETLPWQPL